MLRPGKSLGPRWGQAWAEEVGSRHSKAAVPEGQGLVRIFLRNKGEINSLGTGKVGH